MGNVHERDGYILLVVGVDASTPVEGGSFPLGEAGMGNVHHRDVYILLEVAVDAGMPVEGGNLPLGEAGIGNVHDRDDYDGHGRALRHEDESDRNDPNDGLRVHCHHEANAGH